MLLYNFPNIICPSHSVYIHLPPPVWSKQEVPHSQLSFPLPNVRRGVSAELCVCAYTKGSSGCCMHCNSHVHSSMHLQSACLWSLSLSDLDGQKNCCLFRAFLFVLFRLRQWVEFNKTSLQTIRKSGHFLKKEVGEGDAVLNLTNLFWFRLFLLLLLFHSPPLLMKFLKMRWAVVAIETWCWQKWRLQIYSHSLLVKLDAITWN